MVLLSAIGSDALLGIKIDATSDRYSVGHPSLDPVPLAAPTAATTAAGAAGLVTGTVFYRWSYILAGGFLTAPSVVSTTLTVATKHVTLTDLTNSADPRVIGKIIWRSHTSDTTGFYWIGTVPDNTTETFDDNTAVTSAFIDKLINPMPSATEVGNWGFAFLDQTQFNLDAEYAEQDIPALSGAAGKNRGIVGAITVKGTMQGAIRAGGSVPAISALAGTPVKVDDIASELTRTYSWAMSTSKDTPRSLTGLVYKGGSLRPELFFGLQASQLALTMQGGQVVNDTVTLVGLMHGLSGIGTHASATYLGTVVTRGIRFDAARLTTPLMIKCSTGPSAGVIKFKTKISGAYTGEYTLYYDTTSKKQIKGGTQVSDWWEVLDETGVRVGSDTENRLPFELMFTGDLSTIALNDEFTIPLQMLIPKVGTGVSPYTGIGHKFIKTPRNTGAHCFIKKDGVILESTQASLTLTSPKQLYVALGPEARFGLDIEYVDFATATIQISGRYQDRAWETILQESDRAEVVILLEGERILATAPGVFSTYRELLQFTFPQCKVTQVNAPVSGPARIVEQVTLMAEQPDDTSKDFCTILVQTSQDWDFPA